MTNSYHDPVGDYNEQHESDGTYDSYSDSDDSGSDIEGAPEEYQVKHGVVRASNSLKKSDGEMEVVFGAVEIGKDYDDYGSEKTKKPNRVLQWIKEHKYISIGSGVAVVLLILIISLSVGLSGKPKTSSSSQASKSSTDQQQGTPSVLFDPTNSSDTTGNMVVTNSTLEPTSETTEEQFSGTIMPQFDGTFDMDYDYNATSEPTDFGSRTWWQGNPNDDGFSGTTIDPNTWSPSSAWWHPETGTNVTKEEPQGDPAVPTGSPSSSTTWVSTLAPQDPPTEAPQEENHSLLGSDPTKVPTIAPTKFPTREPFTDPPTATPTTASPTWSPIVWPTAVVTVWPTWSPTTWYPTNTPEPSINYADFFEQPENEVPETVAEAQVEGQESNEPDDFLMRTRRLETEISANGNVSRRKRWASRL